MKLSRVIFLLLSLIMLMLLCGAGAYFCDKEESILNAKAANPGIAIEDAVFSDIPDEILEETVMIGNYVIKNEGTVKIFPSVETKMQINGKAPENDEDILVTIEYPQVLEPGTSEQGKIRITFPGAERLKEGEFELVISNMFIASTGEKGKGFICGPVNQEIRFQEETALYVPYRSRNIALSAVYTDGCGLDEAPLLRWYRSDDEVMRSGDEMKWSLFSVEDDQTFTIMKDHVMTVRYELEIKQGTVRSDIYRIYIKEGELQTESYDYLSGERTDDEVEKVSG